MQRLRIAFKRCSGATGFMSQQIFAREVLGDGVPTKIAEVKKKKLWDLSRLFVVTLILIIICCHFCSQHIFIVIGGTNKGLSFRDLVCGLVLLTRGTREEKIKCEYTYM